MNEPSKVAQQSSLEKKQITLGKSDVLFCYAKCPEF